MNTKRFFSSAAATAMAATVFLSAPAGAQVDDAYIGEVRLFGFSFCPVGWAPADGQLLAVSQNDALFSLLGTLYGGDGRTTFGLPDLRGRVPINDGTGAGLSTYRQGQKGGAETFTLAAANLGPHTHAATTTATLRAVTATADEDEPGNTVILANAGTIDIYNSAANNVGLRNDSIAAATATTNTGGSAAITHRTPYLGLNWCVATVGNYPGRE